MNAAGLEFVYPMREPHKLVPSGTSGHGWRGRQATAERLAPSPAERGAEAEPCCV